MKNLTVNGRRVQVDVDDDKPLLWVLREDLGLTVTKYGRGIAQCGACTVHVDGTAVRACVYPVSAVEDGEAITTLEGLSSDADHPVQQAWAELDIPQCGFYQAGIIMAVAALHGEISFENGRVVEENFDSYPSLTLAEMPEVETIIMPSGGFWGGVGEPTICVAAPAVFNAVYAATGTRIRSLPLKDQPLRSA